MQTFAYIGCSGASFQSRKNGIVGSSLVLVRQGRVVLQDQYGLQNRSPNQRVDESTTVIRIGSPLSRRNGRSW